jgi:hypothetical protein
MTNRANQLLIIELNDGASIYLAPGLTSNPIDEGRVQGNEKIAKLMRNNLLSAAAVEAEEIQAAGEGSAGSSASASEPIKNAPPLETEKTARRKADQA